MYNQPVSIHWWMNKDYVKYIHNGMLLTLKKSILFFGDNMNIQYIMLNAISQAQTDKYQMILLIYEILQSWIYRSRE
jgi:hypothetical protein